MTDEDEYDDQQRALAEDAARMLMANAEKFKAVMVPHAIVTAFLGTGVEFALKHMPPETVAVWLHDIAIEIEDKGDAYDCSGQA